MILPIYYNSPELKTLGDFLSSETTSVAFAYRDKPQQFLEIADSSGKRNFDKILDATPQEKKQLQSQKYLTGGWNQIELFPHRMMHVFTKILHFSDNL